MEQSLLISDLTLYRNITKEVMVHEQQKNYDNSMQDTLLDNPLYHHIILLTQIKYSF